jgi:hypothetical protein
VVLASTIFFIRTETWHSNAHHHAFCACVLSPDNVVSASSSNLAQLHKTCSPTRPRSWPQHRFPVHSSPHQPRRGVIWSTSATRAQVASLGTRVSHQHALRSKGKDVRRG